MYNKHVERRLYASGAGRRDACVEGFKNQSHAPGFGALTFYAPTHRHTEPVRGFDKGFSS